MSDERRPRTVARSRSTTRRCATAPSSRASRSPSTTSCGSPSSSTGSASTTSRRAGRGANPKDDEFFRRAAAGELRLETATLVAFGSTRKPQGQGRHRRRRCATSSRPGSRPSCIVGKSWDYHVIEALGTTLDEGVAMVGDSVAFLRGEGQRVFFDAEHFFDGYKAQPRVRPARARGGRRPRVPSVLVLCDTNGGTLPHEVERIVGEVVAYFGARRSDRHPHSTTTPAARSPTRWPRCVAGRDPGAGHDQRLRRAHRQLQPHDDHPRTSTLKMGIDAACPRAGSSGSPR